MSDRSSLSAATSTPPATTAARPRTTQRRIGLVLSALTALFLLFDAVIHLLRIQPVVDSFTALGFPLGTVRWIAVVELVCLVLYLLPRTSVLGAVLLTGYLGGAVSAHVRVESPLVSTVLFPVYVGIALWAGLWLRDRRLRRELPVRDNG
jgi:hypothetical protein